MFKKTGVLTLLFLYLTTATGFALNLHFCGEYINEVKINAPAKTCGMDSKCCKETHVVVKVKDAHEATFTSFTGKIIALPVFASARFLPSAVLPVSLIINVDSNRGPPLIQTSIFIKNCVFRI